MREDSRKQEVEMFKRWYKRGSILGPFIGGVFLLLSVILMHSLKNENHFEGREFIISATGCSGVDMRREPLAAGELNAILAKKAHDPAYTHSSFIGFLGNGQEIGILEEKGGWYLIEVQVNGRMQRGYIPKLLQENSTVSEK